MDVDALCDKDGNVVICGIMEHIEQAGIHSGDSACSLPTQTISDSVLATIREWTVKVGACAGGAGGLARCWFCVRGGGGGTMRADAGGCGCSS